MRRQSARVKSADGKTDQMAIPLKLSTSQNSARFFDAASVSAWNQTSLRRYALDFSCPPICA